MTPATADPPYPLGDTSAEHARLIRQAAIWDPFTERLFRDAGIGPGQRALDIGSGVGDVAMLAAKLVGPSGAVVGVEREPVTIATARSRVAKAGLSNVSFLESDVRGVASSALFDAVVGRAILQYLPEAGAVLRSLALRVRPGGVSCVSRRMARFAVPSDRPPSAAGQNALRSSIGPGKVRRAYGHGAGPVPRLPGSGPPCSERPYRGSRRRRSERHTMVLRSRLHLGVAPGQGRTRRQRNW